MSRQDSRLAALMNAHTVDEVLAVDSPTLTALADISGQPVTVLGIHENQSAYRPYLVVRVLTHDGVRAVAVGGSLARALLTEWEPDLPYRAVFEIRTTRAGHPFQRVRKIRSPRP